MKKILCPTDFSETAQNAIAYAAKLAQTMHAELTLLNVQSLFDLKPVEILKGKEATVALAAEHLESESRQISKAFKISCYADVETSNRPLSSVIAGIGKSYDLIVMGSDGPNDVYEFFGGSNTYNAIIKSETPLLVIPAGYLYNDIVRMVYAFDYLHEGKIPLSGLMPFVQTLHIDLTILDVIGKDYNKTTDERLKEEQAKIKYLYGEKIDIHYDTLHSEDFAQSINSYMLKNEPDVLALCTHHRNFLQRIFHKSVVKHLTSFSDYPVYVFHA